MNWLKKAIKKIPNTERAYFQSLVAFQFSNRTYFTQGSNDSLVKYMSILEWFPWFSIPPIIMWLLWNSIEIGCWGNDEGTTSWWCWHIFFTFSESPLIKGRNLVLHGLVATCFILIGFNCQHCWILSACINLLFETVAFCKAVSAISKSLPPQWVINA